jgi:hypothetical protein
MNPDAGSQYAAICSFARKIPPLSLPLPSRPRERRDPVAIPLAP